MKKVFILGYAFSVLQHVYGAFLSCPNFCDPAPGIIAATIFTSGMSGISVTVRVQRITVVPATIASKPGGLLDGAGGKLSIIGFFPALRQWLWCCRDLPLGCAATSN